jgi:hypothetical protein
VRALSWKARRAAVLAAALSLCWVSCGPAGPKLHPVKGQVLYQDKAPQGATVVFHPVGGAADAPKPSGTVGEDGSFTLSTYPYGKGAPAGEYIVLVTWYPADAREVENPQNKLPARYADPTRPLLKATVNEGPNELPPFNLKK